MLLRQMLKLLQDLDKPSVIEKPVVVEKVVEKVVVVEKTTLLYICIGVAILMTISAISSTVSCMKWESKYSTLVDRLLHVIQT